MGSRGRRAAESRVGDEEMEEENNRILVVKSDEKWMKFRKALKRVNIKYKIWYLIFFVCPDMTCRLRNYLKIGM